MRFAQVDSRHRVFARGGATVLHDLQLSGSPNVESQISSYGWKHPKIHLVKENPFEAYCSEASCAGSFDGVVPFA
jgi:hypothetical protein